MLRGLKLLPWALLLALFVPLFFFPLTEKDQIDTLPIPIKLDKPANITPVLSLQTGKNSPNDIDELLTNLPSIQWRTNGKSFVSEGMVSGVQWASLPLQNPEDKPKDIIVEFTHPRVQSLSLYQTDDEGRYETLYSALGIHGYFDQREIHYRNIAQQFTLAPNSHSTLYWRIEHTGDLRFQINLWSPQSFFNYTQKDQLFFGIVYGLLTLIIFTNIFTYINFKEKSHLHFAFLSAVSILYISAMEGHLFQFLIIENIKSRLWVLYFSLAFMQIAFALFTNSFLNLRRWSDPLYVGVILAASGSALLFIIGKFTPTVLALSATASLLALLLYILAFVAAIKIRLKGEVSSAGYYASAVLALIICLMLGLLSTEGFLPPIDIPCSFISLGYLAMMLFLTFALVEKLKLRHEDRVIASMELVKLTEEKLKTNLDMYKNKLHELELKKTTDESKIEDRAKNEFLTTMSHDIRTPMSGVLGMTELLLDTNLSPHQLQYVKSINNSGQTLLSVINDLLDYSEIEAGKIDIESTVFNLEDLVDDCISIFSLKAVEKNLNFVGSIKPGTTLILKGDPTKVRQVVLNLLSNVFNFTESGDITLYVYQTEKTTFNSVEIRFEVIDTCIDLNKEEREALFLPFSHSESQSSRKYASQGLGLAICRQLAELMHGDIGVSNDINPDQENTGTTFWFTARFPLPHNDEKISVTDRVTALQGKRLLVIDEHPPFCDLIVTLTSSWGMATDVSLHIADAAETLKQAKHDNNPFDIVILPWQTGNPTLSSLHKALGAGDFGYSPILIGSVQSRYLQSKQPETVGLRCFLVKPVTSKHLHDTLAESLGLSISTGGQNNTHKIPMPHAYENLRVLVAEDNKVNRMVIVGLLSKLNIRPKSASNGKEVIELIKNEEQPFDLIFMDCEMPRMDGYQATKWIRQHEQESANKRNSQTLIIALSAHAAGEYKQKALACGMNEYISKPVNRESIEQVLNRYFAQPSDNRSSNV